MASLRPRRPDRLARCAARLATIAALSLIASSTLAACKSDAVKLPALGADVAATSVSGLSSGAYMAGQFHVAHSRIVIGAGLVAGGPYGCAESVFADQMPGPGTAFLNLSKAINGCMLDAMRAWGVPDVAQLAERVRLLALKDRIDPLDTLVAGRVYLFTGTQDRTVVSSIVRTSGELYAALGTAPARVKLVADVAAGHAFVTTDKGIECGRTAEPYITDCDYDQAGELLAHIYGALQPRAADAGGEYIAFQQGEFLGDLADHGLGDTGVLYVPKACRATAGCRTHIVFHGCNQHLGKLGQDFVRDTGFANWAERNRLLVLFPQTASSPVNPQACWDWWGYSGRDYLTRKGPQIVAVRRMLDRLASKPDRPS